jgi:hypothetical protein
MLDQSLEQKLRGALQAEGDGLALTITAAELERRLALRRGPGLSRVASLGLAAAMTLALIGLAGIAGGWFESVRIGPGPIPSLIASPAPSLAPSLAPSPSGPAALPSLDELLAPLDPAAIIEAQAVGPATGVEPEGLGVGGPLGPGSTTLGPVASAGSYRLWTACVGETSLGIGLLRGLGGAQPFSDIPITCDGQVTSRQIGLAAGDALQVTAPGTGAWRIVLELPGQAAPQATSFEPVPGVVPGEAILVQTRSDRAEPSFDEPGVGVQPAVQRPGGVPTRDRYAVLASCAGPSSIRFAIGHQISGTATALDGTDLEEVAGVVACDGRIHRTELGFALEAGGEVIVTADERTAWQLSVTSEEPPIVVNMHDGTWTLSTGIGPDLNLDGSEQHVSLVGAEPGADVRVVVACEGDGPLKVEVDTGPVEGVTVDRFEMQCEAGSSLTIRKVYPNPTGYVTVGLDPGGKRMWLAVSTQVQVGG